MGKLHEACKRIDEHIKQQHLDFFRTRGKVGLEAGFVLSNIDERTPDDPQRLDRLRDAARTVLGLNLP